MNAMNQSTSRELQLLAELDRAHGQLRDGRHQWMETVDAISDPLMVHDPEGRIVRANKAYAALAGLGFPALLGHKYWECFPRRGEPLRGCLDSAACVGDGQDVEEFAVQGGEIYTSRAFRLGGDHAGTEVLHLFRNVTAERHQQQTMQSAARRAIAQSEALSAIVSSGALFAGDLECLAREITERVSAACDVARVNVWLFNDDETELHCVDHFDAATRAHASGMVLRQSQFDNEFRALKSAPYVAADDPLSDPRTAGYVQSYLQPNRITSMLDAVVSISGRHVGLLCLEHVDRKHHWERDEISFAQQVAEKIAVATSNRRAREAEAAIHTGRMQAQADLRSALVATVRAMAATVEARDPYTAGHQRSVADLAAAIALEMGLSAEAAEGIHFGALIHDLGKVQVPAELLSKPTRLTKLEFELIKTHAQAGYDIVKNLKFPWRVAEMVHQHHERIDGSGYPQGLRGDDIALEARILAVADVTEAMASHRPYRPGLGVEAALKEIQAKRGIWFDAAAVDACLRLFRDKGYTLQKAA
jgi:putative nucleotidyltransferase with HDIG domain